MLKNLLTGAILVPVRVLDGLAWFYREFDAAYNEALVKRYESYVDR